MTHPKGVGHGRKPNSIRTKIRILKCTRCESDKRGPFVRSSAGRICAYCLTAEECEQLVDHAKSNLLTTDHFLEWREQIRDGDIDANIPGDVRTFIKVCNQLSNRSIEYKMCTECACDH